VLQFKHQHHFGGLTLPLYEYECQKCHKVSEKIERVDGPHLKKCPHCGGKVEQKVSRSAIQFKGAGWYVTDYAGKKPAADTTTASANSASDKSDSKESTTKESKDAKESKPSTAEKKPEKKKE
jgi:putative FmdB family regulatory protein